MKWIGAAGICLNEQHELLMVKQGRPEERKTWTVPSGEKEPNETIEQTCIREIKEETGYDVHIQEKAFVKNDHLDGYEVEVHYFVVKQIGGHAMIQDPDYLIYEVGWKSISEIQSLDLSFPRDLKMLMKYMEQRNKRIEK